MTVQTEFSSYDGPLSTRIRRAAADHAESAIAAAEAALKPRYKDHAQRIGYDDRTVFHQHAQAAATLREVAALLDQGD